MMFRVGAFALFCSLVSASSFVPSGDIPADSKLGSSLLKRATVVEPSRHLEQNSRDTTFIANYSIKYLGCSSLVQVNTQGNGQKEGNDQKDGNGGQSIVYTQNLVRFALCPSGSCSSCSGGGEYVVNMVDFVDAYTEAKLTETEYNCEQIRENCNNDDESSCYSAAGATECDQYEGQDVFEIQEYLECRQLGNQNGNDNSNNGQYTYNNYYVGPYCSSKDSKSIYLGVFYDDQCSSRANTNVYANMNSGATLPFSKESIVVSGCISCKDQQNNNNSDQPSELCQEVYQSAAKCESAMSGSQSPDTSGCEFIDNILPRLESASLAITTGRRSGTGNAFAWLFALTTLLFGAYSYFLYRKIKRGSVTLSSQDGSMA
jgi:hypothetical protein